MPSDQQIHPRCCPTIRIYSRLAGNQSAGLDAMLVDQVILHGSIPPVRKIDQLLFRHLDWRQCRLVLFLIPAFRAGRSFLPGQLDPVVRRGNTAEHYIDAGTLQDNASHLVQVFVPRLIQYVGCRGKFHRVQADRRCLVRRIARYGNQRTVGLQQQGQRGDRAFLGCLGNRLVDYVTYIEIGTVNRAVYRQLETDNIMFITQNI